MVKEGTENGKGGVRETVRMWQRKKTKNKNSGVRETVKKERKMEIVGARETVNIVKERTENG